MSTEFHLFASHVATPCDTFFAMNSAVVHHLVEPSIIRSAKFETPSLCAAIARSFTSHCRPSCRDIVMHTNLV